MVELDDETTTPTISMTATRTCAAACLGAAFAAAWRSCHAATVSTAHPNSDFAMEPANLLAKALLPPDKGGLNPVAANPSRYFLISQAVALMVALKMAPEGLISEVVGRVNPEISQWVFRLIGEFCAIDKVGFLLIA
ncbi:unnamed protein product [Protopolystoma xenopodis]|uniref:Uncharacterized protein n=1 Tax=Protopolystoma xenopodis TaxID=117903 RepID=A0A3S5CKY1_9PLAT|nr:unnamed protein product [Protopolystoma xenopodis]